MARRPTAPSARDARNEDGDAADPVGRLRLDKWLWAARFFKTRALAAEAIEGGKVSLNGDRAKRAKPVGPGDELQLRLGPYEHHVIVRGISPRRGPASEAATLYEETEASRTARSALALQLKSAGQSFTFEEGRPSKKERRVIDRFRGR